MKYIFIDLFIDFFIDVIDHQCVSLIFISILTNYIILKFHLRIILWAINK